MALRSIAGLRDLRDGGLRLKVNVNFTMTEDNAGEAARVFDFCRDNRMEFNPIMPVFGELYRNEGIDLSLSERARALLVDFFEKRLGDRNGSALAYSVVLDQLRGQAREFRCWAGQVILLVKENGDVYPNGGCPPGWLLGNLRTSGYDMKRLLESDRARLVRARIRRCRACRLPCETLTTLKYPEAYHAYRKTKQLRAARRRSA
jgi:MoaA/NifB/PqqE/SkfB family radical SAM enzyme